MEPVIQNVEEKKSKESNKENLGSLLNLFKSEYFTLDMCLLYINKRLETGVHDYLVNKLYSYSDHEVSFYIPQICYLLIKRQSPSIERFILDKCKAHLTLFIKIFLCLNSFAKCNTKTSRTQQEYVTSLLLRAERQMINGSMKPLVSQPQGGEIQKIDYFQIVKQDVFIKNLRSECLGITQKFTHVLVGLSLRLKQHEDHKRVEVVKEYIKKINIWLKQHRRNALQDRETANLYEGVQLPFLDPTGKDSSYMIAEINEEEITCFNTRKRVPFKVVFETIDPKEFQSNNERTMTSMVSPKRKLSFPLRLRASSVKQEQNAFTVVSIDDLVDEVTMDEKTIKQIRQQAEESKYQGLKQFSKIVQQEEKKMKKSGRDSLTESKNNMTEINGDVTQTINPIINGKRNSVHISTEPSETGLSNKFKPRMSLKPTNAMNGGQTWNYFDEKDEQYLNYQKEINHAENMERFKEFFPAFSLMKRSKSLEGKGTAHRRHQRRSSMRQFSFEESVKYLEVYKMMYMPSSHEERVNKILTKIHKKIDERELLEFHWINEDLGLDQAKTIFGERWNFKQKQITLNSPFGHFPSYKLRPYIVKGGDDLRQELIAMQLIYRFSQIWEKAGLSLKLRPYDIIVISEDSGLIEYVPDTVSLDYLKKNTKDYKSLKEFYLRTFDQDFEEAQKNFMDSLAGYSLLTFLLNIKDRHNGNILINAEGHIIHIDFGFIFSSSPGNVNFESAPFKLTPEYVELCGGLDSDTFSYFKIQLMKGLIELRKNLDSFVYLLNIMKTESNLPCFEHFDEKSFRERFKEFATDKEIFEYIEKLIEWSYNNWRTNRYDVYQKLTNGIIP